MPPNQRSITSLRLTYGERLVLYCPKHEESKGSDPFFLAPRSLTPKLTRGGRNADEVRAEPDARRRVQRARESKGSPGNLRGRESF